ncbi:DUF4352 domain-containing protein [Lactiplantibacillus herbarum]|uniref:DUF4352 domain-containing protein n=1 Tax=Lactiplantibacillus herbarum TaxID=1670446 RepID=UPI00064EB064|nr:DUF4352 domain-containing protein [Lactiplantibacillus herbarum]
MKKKAWYQKWWIWVLIILGIIFLSGVFAPTNSDSTDKSSTSSAAKHVKKRATTKTNTNQVFKVGETATIDHVKVTVNSVKTATSLDMSDPKTGNQFYTVNVTLKNTGSEKVSYNPYDFAIKSNGNQTDLDEINTDDNDQLDSGDLAAGGTVSGNMTGQSKKDGTVELVYTPSYFSERHLTFKLQ